MEREPTIITPLDLTELGRLIPADQKIWYSALAKSKNKEYSTFLGIGGIIAENATAKGVHMILTDRGVFYLNKKGQAVFTQWLDVILRGNNNLWLVIREPYPHFETLTLIPDAMSEESKGAFKSRSEGFPREVLHIQIQRWKESVEAGPGNGDDPKLIADRQKVLSIMEKRLEKELKKRASQ